MTRAFRTSVLIVACSLAARSAEARYLYETPADILKIRGMPAALIVCGVGLVLLLRAAEEFRPAPPDTGWLHRARWLLVVWFMLFIYASVPIGFQVARAIVVQIGHTPFKNAINAAGAIFGAVFTWRVLRQSGRQRWPVATAIALIALG